MNTVRIMPCLDMKDGRVVKGIHFRTPRIRQVKEYLQGRGIATNLQRRPGA